MTGALWGAFAHTILPLALVTLVGWVVGRFRPMPLEPVTALAMTALVPAIVFDSLARTELPPAVLGRVALHVALQLVCLGGLALLVARAVRWRGASRSALLLATLFANGGNIGLPLVLFALGQAGVAVAGGWFALSAISVHTLGAFIAARARAGVPAALQRLARAPILYAIAAGVAMNLAGWRLPVPLGRATGLLAQGSIAVLLLLVGLQLARLSPRAEARGAVAATLLRLVAAPPVAWLTGRLIGLEGVALAAVVLQASTPTAVTALLWALEFDTRPSLVAATVVISTLGGVLTLTLLVALLAGGAG